MAWTKTKQQYRRQTQRRRQKKVGGVSIFGLIIAIILWQVFGISPETTLGVAQQIQGQATTAPTHETADMAESKAFVATILADTEDVWTPIFLPNQDTTISHQVWFCLAVLSNLPAGQPLQPVVHFIALLTKKSISRYTVFFVICVHKWALQAKKNHTELTRQDQAADFAQAYVIAHEVGHHVQTLLGISQQVHQAQIKANQTVANNLSVRLELQADCFAGLWARHNHERTQFLQQGDIEEALDAAKKNR